MMVLKDESHCSEYESGPGRNYTQMELKTTWKFFLKIYLHKKCFLFKNIRNIN